MSESLQKFYSAPSHQQVGGELPVFAGSRRQIGGSFLSGLARFAIPILRFLAPRALNMAKNVANDVLVENKPILGSLKEHGMHEAGKVLRGEGRKRVLASIRKRKQAPSINKYNKRMNIFSK